MANSLATLDPAVDMAYIGNTLVGGATFSGILASGVGGSYIDFAVQADQSTSSFFQVQFNNTFRMPANSQLRAIQLRVNAEYIAPGTAPVIVHGFRTAPGINFPWQQLSAALYASAPPGGTSTDSVSTSIIDVSGYNITDAQWNNIPNFQWWLQIPGPAAETRIYPQTSHILQIFYNQPPQATVSINGQTGTASLFTPTPVINWTYSDPENDPQERFRVKIYDQVNGVRGKLTYDSGEQISGANSFQVPQGVLAPYRKYLVEVLVSDSGSNGRYNISALSPGNTIAISTDIDPLLSPVFTPQIGSTTIFNSWAWDPSSGAIKNLIITPRVNLLSYADANMEGSRSTSEVSFGAWAVLSGLGTTLSSLTGDVAWHGSGTLQWTAFPPNLLTTNQASLETGTVTGWSAGANTTIAASNAQAYQGAYSLGLTATGAGAISATTTTGTSGLAIIAYRYYTASAWFRASSANRSCTIAIAWYDSSGALISTTTGSAITDTNAVVNGWTQAAVSGNAPGTAAFAAVQVTVTGAAASEVHYVDDINLINGALAQTVQIGSGFARQIIPGGVITGVVHTAMASPSARVFQLQIGFYDANGSLIVSAPNSTTDGAWRCPGTAVPAWDTSLWDNMIWNAANWMTLTCQAIVPPNAVSARLLVNINGAVNRDRGLLDGAALTHGVINLLDNASFEMSDSSTSAFNVLFWGSNTPGDSAAALVTDDTPGIAAADMGSGRVAIELDANSTASSPTAFPTTGKVGVSNSLAQRTYFAPQGCDHIISTYAKRVSPAWASPPTFSFNLGTGPTWTATTTWGRFSFLTTSSTTPNTSLVSPGISVFSDGTPSNIRFDDLSIERVWYFLNGDCELGAGNLPSSLMLGLATASVTNTGWIEKANGGLGCSAVFDTSTFNTGTQSVKLTVTPPKSTSEIASQFFTCSGASQLTLSYALKSSNGRGRVNLIFYNSAGIPLFNADGTKVVTLNSFTETRSNAPLGSPPSFVIRKTATGSATRGSDTLRGASPPTGFIAFLPFGPYTVNIPVEAAYCELQFINDSSIDGTSVSNVWFDTVTASFSPALGPCSVWQDGGWSQGGTTQIAGNFSLFQYDTAPTWDTGTWGRALWDSTFIGWAGNNATVSISTSPVGGTTNAVLQLTSAASGFMLGTTSPGLAGFPVVPNQTYMATAQFATAVTPEPCSVSIIWYDSNGAAIGVPIPSTAAVDAVGIWANISVTATAPANALYAALQVSVTAQAANEIHYVNFATLTSAGQVLAGVQNSSDGVNWNRFVRVPGKLGAITQAISPGQSYSFTDYEWQPALIDTPVASTLYRAVMQVLAPNGSVVYSIPSPYVVVPLTAIGQRPAFQSDWWLIDPNTPGDNALLQVKKAKFSISEEMQSLSGLGRSRRVVIGDVVQGDLIDLTLQTLSGQQYAALMKQTKKQATLVVRSPDGEMWYVRATKRDRERVWTGNYFANTLRTYTVQLQEVDPLP